MSVFPPACPFFEPLNCHQKGQKGAGSHRACLPRSQTSRQAVVHSPLVTGCSFLAWVLEGGQGAVRLHGNLGTEPWRLPGHEVGFWHQERGSSYLAQNHLCRDHSTVQVLVGPHSFCPPRKAGLEAETYLEGMAGTIRGHWSKGSYVSHGGAEGECLEWRREWCMCPARGQSGLHPSSLLCCGTRAAFNHITNLPPLPPMASDPDGVCKLCPYSDTKALPGSSQIHPISGGPPVAGFSIMFFSL